MPRGKSNVTYGEADCLWCGDRFVKRKKWQQFCQTDMTDGGLKAASRCRFNWHNWRKRHGTTPVPGVTCLEQPGSGSDEHDDV